MIEKYIHELLFVYDCVIVPDFGAFVTHRVSADIHPLTNKFYPPTKTVAFNEQLTQDEGLLINHICQEEKISIEESSKKVADFVKNVKDSLVKLNIFILPNLGRFFLNFNGNLEFEPDYSINLLDDSFGLTELYSKPIDRNYSDMNKVSTRIRPLSKKTSGKQDASKDGNSEERLMVDIDGDKPKRSLSMLLILPLTLLVVSTGILVYINKTGSSLAGILPGIMVSHHDKDEGSDEVKKVNPESESAISAYEENNEYSEEPVIYENETHSTATETTSNATTSGENLNFITSATNKYYIIVGSFSRKNNALRLRKKIIKQGGAPLLIANHDNSNFKVAITRYESSASALEKLEIYKAAFGDQIWILYY